MVVAYSNSKFTHRIIIIHWPLFMVQVERFHCNSYQRETVYDKLIFLFKSKSQTGEQNLTDNIYFSY